MIVYIYMRVLNMTLKMRVVLASIKLGRYNKATVLGEVRKLPGLNEERGLMDYRRGWSNYIVIEKGENDVQKERKK
ncbi:hypothetical protein JCM14467A_07340 [Vulcanisaeta sp. JCM 14467]